MGFTLKNKFQTQSGFLNLSVGSAPVFTISYLVVGAGGGAGSATYNEFSSGGGAGGLLTGSLSWASGITFVATRGVYGANGQNDGDAIDYAGSNGGNSSLVYGSNTILAYGGGGGGSGNFNGGNGGSGGGSGEGFSAPTGISGQGYNGGLGYGGDGGGGGGAGSIGGDRYFDEENGDYTGIGGNGLVSSITGTSIIYSAGASGTGADNNSNNPTGWGGKGSGGNRGAVGQVSAGDGWNGVVILSVPASKYTGIITGSPSVDPNVNGNTIITWNGLSGTYIS
jgi:hypothetical protein